jgi:hypothetical protein
MNAVNNSKDNQNLNRPRRSRSLVLAVELCVSCGKAADKFTDFTDKRSSFYFGISGLCQCCQDKFFSEDMSNEG